MNHILLIQSSPRGAQSISHQVAEQLVSDLKKQYPGACVTTRDLAIHPLPHVDFAYVDAVSARPEQRSPEQQEKLALSEELISELMGTDLLILSTPMHNFTIASGLKSWFDQIVQAGRTFTFSEHGPVGLMIGKRAILVLASGGVYSTGPMQSMDFQRPYLEWMLSFIGITDVEVIRAEGVAISSIGPAIAKANAIGQMEALLKSAKYPASAA